VPTGTATRAKKSSRSAQGVLCGVDQIHAEKAGGDRRDQAGGGHHGQPDDRVGLPAQAVAVEVLAHVLDFLAQFGIQILGAQVLAGHAEQGARLRLVGDLVEPVAMGEAQEDLEDLAEWRA
jgi:hypothetical protein